MSTAPLTEAELVVIERHCTSRQWPAHDWQPARASAHAAICSQCDCYASADPQRVLLPCFRRGQPLSPSAALRLVAEVRRLRAALATIRDDEGRVCSEFETCWHVGCRSSHAAWEIADAALGGERSEP